RPLGPRRQDLVGWGLEVKELRKANPGTAIDSANYGGVSTCRQIKKSSRFQGVGRGQPILHDIRRAGIILPIVITSDGRAICIIDGKRWITQGSSDSAIGKGWSDSANDDRVICYGPNNEPAD